MMTYMSEHRRATVYFDPDIHRALRLLAAETERSVSELVNDAVRARLLEESEDRSAFDERSGDQILDFEDFVTSLRERGRL